MSEIEKLMQNAGVEKEWRPLPYGDIEEFYPEFTAEKQLELICFIVKSKERISFTNKPYILTRDVLAIGLAFAINNLWQDLTDTEKAEIKKSVPTGTLLFILV